MRLLQELVGFGMFYTVYLFLVAHSLSLLLSVVVLLYYTTSTIEDAGHREEEVAHVKNI